ncbi:MAG: ABC transporter permease [Suipraeoptans sp.]
MRNPLNKRHKRELKTHMGRYIAIFVIFVTMVMIVSGFLVTAYSVEDVFTNNRTEKKVEDGEFSTADELPGDVIKELEKLKISIYNNDYKDSRITKEMTVRVFENRKDINLATYWEGKEPESENEVAIERLSAQSAGIEIGDEVSIGDHEFKVVGIMSSPDFSALFEDNANIMMDHKSFGVAFVSRPGFDKIDEETIYTYSYVYDDGDFTKKEKIDINDDIKEELVKSQVEITNYMTADDNQSISFVSDDMGSDVPMMKMFLYVIVVIIAFVFTIILLSTIEEEAATIGTLYATGMKKRELIIHYLTLPLIVMFIAAIIGNVLGYTAGVNLFKDMYYSSYSLPPLVLTFNLDAFLSTTLYPILIILAINLILINRKLSLSPLRFIRRDLSRSRKKRAIKLPKISFTKRFTTRVIIQNRGNYITLFLGIVFASIILMFGLCMQPLLDHYIDSTKDAVPFEYQYILNAPYDVSDGADAEKYTTTLEYANDKADKAVTVSAYGLENDSRFWDIDTKGLKDNEVIVSDTFMKKYNLKIGQKIEMTDVATQLKFSLKIVEEIPYPPGFTLFFNIEELNNMLEYENEYYTGYLSNDELTDIPNDDIVTTITETDLVKMGEQSLDSFADMAGICLVASGIVYLVLLYIITKLVMDKNAKSISFMKIMGYRDNEVGRIYLRATTVVVIASLILSLPIAYFALGVLMLWGFSMMNGYIEIYVGSSTYIIMLVVGVVVYALINRIHIRRIKKIEMGEVLKDKE